MRSYDSLLVRDTKTIETLSPSSSLSSRQTFHLENQIASPAQSLRRKVADALVGIDYQDQRGVVRLAGHCSLSRLRLPFLSQTAHDSQALPRETTRGASGKFPIPKTCPGSLETAHGH
jgi:hypothetical protein